MGEGDGQSLESHTVWPPEVEPGGLIQLDLVRVGLGRLLVPRLVNRDRNDCLFQFKRLHRPVGDQEGCEQSAHGERCFKGAIHRSSPLFGPDVF